MRPLLKQTYCDTCWQTGDVTVTEFSRKKYELEEVFMEIVKGDGDGR